MLEFIKQSDSYRTCNQLYKQAMQLVSKHKYKLLSGTVATAVTAYAFSRRDTSASGLTSFSVIPDRILGDLGFYRVLNDLGFDVGRFSERERNLKAFISALDSNNLELALDAANKENIVSDQTCEEGHELAARVLKIGNIVSNGYLVTDILYRSNFGQKVLQRDQRDGCFV